MRSAKTAKAEIRLLTPDIVYMRIFDEAHLELGDVKELNRLKRELVGNNAHSVLLVSGKYTTIAKEAREFSSGKEVGENRKAKAIVVSSLAQSLIANFFIKFHRTGSKVRAFDNEAAALAWLQRQ